MSIDFSEAMSLEDKVAMLEQRISQFKADGYAHTLNRKEFELADDVEKIAETDAALATISASIELHQTELDSLGV